MPATLSILTNVFRDPKERARAIAIWAGCAGLGVAIGPVVGGLLLEHFSWHSVFRINVPVIVLADRGRLVPRADSAAIPTPPASTSPARRSPSSAWSPWCGRSSRRPATAGPTR